MAHELSIRKDGKAEMAFVGETPWHGLGQNVTKGASIGVWAKEAGMDWEAREASVYFEHDKRADGPTATEADGYKMLYRSDNQGQLAIVGSGYEVVQPRDVLEFFRDMTESGGWWIHTAGVLREGRKIWAMATNGDEGSVGRGDSIKRNLILATSLDGSMKTIVMETTVRVVCANTLSIALGKDVKKQVQVSHRTQFDAELVKRALGVNQDSFKVFMEQAKEMADTPVKLNEARDLLRAIFKVEDKPTIPGLAWLGNLANIGMEDEAKENRSVARCLEMFAGDGMGADLKSAKGTRWGLLNAVTEYVDHESGRTPDTRLDSAWFGRGLTTKQHAFDLISA